MTLGREVRKLGKLVDILEHSLMVNLTNLHKDRLELVKLTIFHKYTRLRKQILMNLT